MSLGNVVLVDDSHTLRQLVSQMIRHLGWEPHAFESAANCVNDVLHVHPALVLMDFEMDPVRGDDACRSLKSCRELFNTPVVMMTNGDDPARLQSCHRANADDFIPKPIKLQQLQAKLRVLEPSARKQVQQQPARARRVLAVDAPSGDTGVWKELEFSGFQVTMGTGDPKELATRIRTDTALDAVVVRMSGCTSAGFYAIRAACAGKDLPIVKLVDQTSLLKDPGPERPGTTVHDGQHDTSAELSKKLHFVLKRFAVDVRTSPRVPFFSSVLFRAKGGEWESGYSSDISKGGLFVRTLTAATPLTEIEVVVDFPGHRAMQLAGVVAWARAYASGASAATPAGMGIKFGKLSGKQDQLVADVLNEALRQAS